MGYSEVGLYKWSGLPLVRYSTDGSLDNTFGNGGKVYTVNTSFGYTGQAVTIQPDGKIVVVRGVNNYPEPSKPAFMLARHNSNGSPDSSFGANGIVLSFITGSSIGGTAYALALQADNKILAAGHSYKGFTLVRYLSDLSVGILDPTVTSDEVLIYPNPVTGEATLQYTLL